MSKSFVSKLIAALLVVVFPYTMFAAEPADAMLYVHGSATLNGSNVPRSSALFPGDFVQTTPDSVANINASGTVILVRNSSLVEYQTSAVNLEHGAVTVSTSKALATRAGDVKITPADSVWTDFEVKDVDGTVHIIAHKGDLLIADASGTSRLSAGQATTRDESQSDQSQKDRKRKGAGTVPAAKGGVLDSPMVIGVAAGVAAGVGAWAILQGDEPESKD